MKPAFLALSASLCLAALLGPQVRAVVLVEDFDDNQINPALWTAYVYGSGPQIAETDHQLEVAMPGNSSGVDFGVKLASRFLLRGDFDVQVDFRLFTWPYANGVRMGLGMDTQGLLPHPGVERISFGQNDYPGAPREAYLTDFPDGVYGITETGDVTGRLRLVRSGATQTGYYYDAGGWVAIHTGPAPTTDVAVKVATWSGYQFMHWDVTAAYDNFVVNRGDLVWPYGPVGACCLPGGDCLLSTWQDCEEAGGSYVGDSVLCEPDPCDGSPVESFTWGRMKTLFR